MKVWNTKDDKIVLYHGVPNSAIRHRRIEVELAARTAMLTKFDYPGVFADAKG